LEGAGEWKRMGVGRRGGAVRGRLVCASPVVRGPGWRLDQRSNLRSNLLVLLLAGI
jgi:hypothetical protein